MDAREAVSGTICIHAVGFIPYPFSPAAAAAVIVVVQIMDTGEAVVDDEDDESDALFTMDDVIDGTADTKNQNTEEVSWFSRAFWEKWSCGV